MENSLSERQFEHSSSNKKWLLLCLLRSFKSSLQSLTVIKSSLIVNLICLKSGRLSWRKIHGTDTRRCGKSTSKHWRCYINRFKRKTVRNGRKRATQSLIQLGNGWRVGIFHLHAMVGYGVSNATTIRLAVDSIRSENLHSVRLKAVWKSIQILLSVAWFLFYWFRFRFWKIFLKNPNNCICINFQFETFSKVNRRTLAK